MNILESILQKHTPTAIKSLSYSETPVHNKKNSLPKFCNILDPQTLRSFMHSPRRNSILPRRLGSLYAPARKLF